MVINLNKIAPINTIHFLFDLDGLLVDSEPLQLESFERLAKIYDLNLPTHFEENYKGKSAKENIIEIFHTYDTDHLNKLLNKKGEIIFNLIENKGLKLMPGVLNLLNLIKSNFEKKRLH